MNTIEQQVLNTIRHPVLMVDGLNKFTYVNSEAEGFFATSSAILKRDQLESFVPRDHPLFSLIEQAREQYSPFREYRVDIASPRLGRHRTVDIYVAPVLERAGHVVIMLQPRAMAEKLDRQMTHRSAARSVTGLASMLAHEIKNPLSGIRGAAQLLEMAASDEDRSLTQLIMEETDRIVALVDRMEEFSDERPIERDQVNIHVVLNHVKMLAQNGFAKNIEFVEEYDPSLPPVFANRDQLIQVFLNLVKNAAEVLEGIEQGKITLTTAFRPGVRISVPGSRKRVSLPLEFCVRDNGSGITDDLKSHIFDPFITTKTNGSGLGLAMVAKIIGDHGGVIECLSDGDGTNFRILMPAFETQSKDR